MMISSKTDSSQRALCGPYKLGHGITKKGLMSRFKDEGVDGVVTGAEDNRAHSFNFKFLKWCSC